MLQFYSIGIITLLSVISPGPDFIIICKYALCESREKAIFCAFGITLGILIHVSYCLLGIALIISQSILLFTTLKLLGATYLIYLGGQGIWSADKAPKIGQSEKKQLKTAYNAFKEGLTINLFNPKCSLFMLSIFTMMIEPNTPLFIQTAYGVEIAFIALCWFCLLAFFISLKQIKQRFLKAQYWISRVTSILLVGLGVKIILET